MAQRFLSEEDVRSTLDTQRHPGQRYEFSNVIFPLRMKWLAGTRKYIDFKTVEFAGTIIESGMFKKCIFEDCLFERVNFKAAYWNGVSFNRCKFVLCDFGQNELSIIKFCIFKECEFTTCVLSHLRISDAKFLDCNFDHVNHKDVQVENCEYTSVVADGICESVNFINCVFKTSNFENVALRNCGMVNVKINSSKFICSPTNFLITGESLQRSKVLLKEKLSPGKFNDLCKLVDLFGKGISLVVVDEDLLADFSLDEQRDIFSALFLHRFENKN